MTPKEKAKELVDYFDKCNLASGSHITPFQVKQCAFKVVDEIWKALKPHDDLKEINPFYWQQVKEEIEKL